MESGKRAGGGRGIRADTRERTETEPGRVPVKKPDWIIGDRSELCNRGIGFWLGPRSKRNADEEELQCSQLVGAEDQNTPFFGFFGSAAPSFPIGSRK